MTVDALEIGKAAEHLVCADLLFSGYRTFLSDQGLPYDVVVDVDGTLLRVQVKAALGPRNVNATGRHPRMAYSFNVRRCGKTGSNRLSNTDCDLVALVAVDIRAIAYLPLFEASSSCNLMLPGFEFKGRYSRNKRQCVNEFPFDAALARFFDNPASVAANQLPPKRGGLIEINGEYRSVTEWARRNGIRPSLVFNRLDCGWSPLDAVTEPANQGATLRERQARRAAL